MTTRFIVDERLTIDSTSVDLVFKSMLGHPAREADKAAVNAMGGTIGALADFMWDHWMGEPGHPTRKEVRAQVVKTLLNAGVGKPKCDN